jgi:hypothetical protein
VTAFWDDEVKPRFEALHKWLIKLKEYLEREFKKAWETAHTAMTTVATWISGTLNKTISDIKDKINLFKDAVEFLRAKFAEFMVSDFVVGIQTWIAEMSTAFETFAGYVWGVYNAIAMLIAKWKEWVGTGGKDTSIEQTAGGVRPLGVGQLPTLNAALANAAATAALGGGSAVPSGQSLTLQVNFGDVTVNGSDELADDFMAKTTQALTDRLGRLVQPLRDQYKLASARGVYA